MIKCVPPLNSKHCNVKTTFTFNKNGESKTSAKFSALVKVGNQSATTGQSRIKCILLSVLTPINIREYIVILGWCCLCPVCLMEHKDWLDQRCCSIITSAHNSMLAAAIKLNVRCDLCYCWFNPPTPLLHSSLAGKETWTNISPVYIILVPTDRMDNWTAQWHWHDLIRLLLFVLHDRRGTCMYRYTLPLSINWSVSGLVCLQI